MPSENGNHYANGHQRNGHVNLDGNGRNTADAIPVHDPASSAGQALFWDSLPPAVIEKLAQPLDPALVSQRKGRGNKSFDYIEGHTVIGQANEIFGYGGWGYELAGDVSLRRIEKVDAKTGEMKVSFAYSAPVRVTVPGAPSRTDIGFQVVAEDTPEGHETAVKGAVTDGMKRALRSFGGRFGNGLYGDQPATSARSQARPSNPKGSGKSGQGSDAPSGDSPAQQMRARLVELGAQQGFDEAQVRQAVKGQTGKDLDELPAKDIKPLVERASRKVQQQDAGAQAGHPEK